MVKKAVLAFLLIASTAWGQGQVVLPAVPDTGTENAIDYGAKGDGVTDDGPAFQAAIDAFPSTGGTLYIPAGRVYAIATKISLSGKDNVHIVSDGAILKETSATPTLTAFFDFDDCQYLTIRGIDFQSTETYAYYSGATPSEIRCFIDCFECNHLNIQDCTGLDKRQMIYLNRCDYTEIQGIRFNGFFQDYVDGAQATPNYASAIRVTNSDYVGITNFAADHHGSAILVDSVCEHVTISNVHGHDFHDNGIYISSGEHISIHGCSFKRSWGDGIQVRGSFITVANNSISVAEDVGIAATGLTTADAFGAGGHGISIIGNSIDHCDMGIRTTVNSSLYLRDVTVSGNSVVDTLPDWRSGETYQQGERVRSGTSVYMCDTDGVSASAPTGTGTDITDGTTRWDYVSEDSAFNAVPPMSLIVQGGLTVTGNTISSTAADYGIFMGGADDGAEAASISVVGNTIKDINGGSEVTDAAVWLQYASSVNLTGNSFSDVPRGFYLRDVQDGTITGNSFAGGEIIRIDTTDDDPSGLVLTNNNGTIETAGLAGNTISYSVLSYGAKGDGTTDDSTAIQSAFSDAAASVSSTSARITVFIPSGEYAIGGATQLFVPVEVDVEAEGASFLDTRSSYSTACLIVGESNEYSYGGTYRLPKFRRADDSFDFPYTADDTYAAVRVRNCRDGKFFLQRFQYFNIGVQLLPDAGYSCGYNEFRGGLFQECKIGVDLRGNTSTGWVNENTFYDLNFTTTTGINEFGSVHMARFSKESGGYALQENNRFLNCTSQPGQKSAAFDWSSGKTVNENYRYCTSDDNEYVVTSAGDAQTGGTDEPDGTTPYTDNNSVVWTLVGRYSKNAVLHDGAGRQNIFTGLRLESGYGPSVLFEGVTSALASSLTGNRYEVAEFGSIDAWSVGGSTARDIDDYTSATVAGSLPLDNSIAQYNHENDFQAGDVLRDIYKTAIGSGANGYLTMPGFGFVQESSPDTILQHNNDNGAFVFGVNYLRVNATGSSYIPTAFLNCENLKRFRVRRDTPDSSSSYFYVTGFDKAWGNVAITDAGQEVMGEEISVTSGILYEGSSSRVPKILAVPDDSTVVHLGVGIGDGTYISSISANYICDRLLAFGTVRFETPWGSNDISTRYAYGTPDQGWFRNQGELIQNINTSAGQPSGWRVTTAGMLATAWAGSTAVLEGELRSASGNVYYATSAGTTGATTPTGTTTSNDDNIIWQYLDSEAVLEAVDVLFSGTETATGTYTINAGRPTAIDSSGGAVTATLGSGDFIGQMTTIVMTDASNSSTVTVTNHATTDGEVGTFAAVDAFWTLVWTGTEWANVASDGVTGI